MPRPLRLAPAARLSRRGLLRLGLAVPVALPFAGPIHGLRAEETVELIWQDLLPEGSLPADTPFLGVLEHGQGGYSPREVEMRHDWDGKRVRLPGFAVPLDFDGEGSRAFLLVPYVGACIHVPPPPANQIVYVTAEVPYPFEDMFEPVWVTGTFMAANVATDLADDVGYSLSADLIEPYED